MGRCASVNRWVLRLICAVKEAGRATNNVPATSRQLLASSVSGATSSVGRGGDVVPFEGRNDRLGNGAAECATLRIIDAPPGTSCSMVEAVRGSDVVVLVTDPTPFGIHDLSLAHETVAAPGLPVAVVINRAGLDDESVRACCQQAQIPVLGELPDDRNVAHAYSCGQLACVTVAGYSSRIREILEATLTFAGAS